MVPPCEMPAEPHAPEAHVLQGELAPRTGPGRCPALASPAGSWPAPPARPVRSDRRQQVDGDAGAAVRALYHRLVNYELYMREAIAEARLGMGRGEAANGAVAVLDDAMVARAHDQVEVNGDPTAHAVLLALREAARRLGREARGGLTVFATQEPCSMCVGALLECDVDTLVFALPDSRGGAAGSVVQLARHDGLPRRVRVVSGILQDDVADLVGEAGPVGGRASRASAL